MRGKSLRVKEILDSQSLYKIPAYQRNYQWSENLWQALVSDIVIASTNPNDSIPHWLGILLISESTEPVQPGSKDKLEYIVLDGQQRLTTIALWVAAVIHHANDNEIKLDYSVEQLASISLQESDKKAFEIALRGDWRAPEYFSLQNHQILRAYGYFRYLLWLGQDAVTEEHPVEFPEIKAPNSQKPFEKQWESFISSKKKGKEIPRGSSVDSQLLLNVTLNNISIFSLVHQPEFDETQAVIFETLNGHRQELEPLDYVRNSLFVRIDEIESTELYNKYWYPAETALRKVSLKKMTPGKDFIYDYLISRGETSRQRRINLATGYSHFATMIKDLQDSDIGKFVTDDLVPAMLTWQVVVRTEDKVTYGGVEYEFPKEALQLMTNVHNLSRGPANPVVLHYATGYVRGLVLEKDLIRALFFLENFLVRQILAGHSMSPLRARLMDLMGNINGKYDVEVLKTLLKNSDWVSDAYLQSMITTKILYKSSLRASALGVIFSGIERALSGKGAMIFDIGESPENYTIERIFPKKASNWLSDIEIWRALLENYQPRLHALGNLTVVTRKHNLEVGNMSFSQKQSYSRLTGKAAPLSLNKGWLDTSVTDWTPERIDQRSHDLLSAALKYWGTL